MTSIHPPSSVLAPVRHCGPLPEQGLSRFHSWLRPLPEFPALSHVNEAVCLPGHRLPEHAHPAWEICYFIAGRATWSSGGRSFPVAAGDVFISRPGEPHGGLPDPQDPNHDCAIGFDPTQLQLGRTGAGDLGTAMAEVRTCDDAFGLSGARVIHVGPGPERIIRQILAELDALDGDPRRRALAVAMIQALLVELFVLVTRAGLAAAVLPPVASGREDLRELLAWIGGRLDDPPSLDGMAARIGLSPSHLAAVFRRELGRTPLEQVTDMRIAEACRRLADHRLSITRLAHDLGFCSSQYFSAVFRRCRGCTPGAWRQRNLGG